MRGGGVGHKKCRYVTGKRVGVLCPLGFRSVPSRGVEPTCRRAYDVQSVLFCGVKERWVSIYLCCVRVELLVLRKYLAAQLSVRTLAADWLVVIDSGCLFRHWFGFDRCFTRTYRYCNCSRRLASHDVGLRRLALVPATSMCCDFKGAFCHNA